MIGRAFAGWALWRALRRRPLHVLDEYERDRPRWFDWFRPDEWRALAEYAIAEGASVDHDPGGPCIVLGLMYSHFPPREAHHLLLEYTCCSFSDTDALPQALALVDAHAV